MRERNNLDSAVMGIRKIEKDMHETSELIEMAEEEGDKKLLSDLERQLADLQANVEKEHLKSLLSGELDANDAYLEVNAGAGGTEAQDWAEMLLRMYIRWCAAHNYKTKLLQETPGEEAGLKSATLLIEGENAYGWLKSEKGVHRLVRISPFDSNSRRHTSFASVALSPVVEDDIEIELNEADLRIDTFRSSGAGGQHVNTTDSAVRITHLPTGTVAACQSERSQHQNKAHALLMLKAKLYELRQAEKEELEQAAQGEKTDIAWGHQIRSYVLHPYQMIKDLRTGVETTDSQGVLNGDISRFLEAALAAAAGREKSSPS